jgi:hypothetical protein
MQLNIVHLVDYINVMHVLKHLFDQNIYVIMILYDIHINIHFGKEYFFILEKKQQHNFFFIDVNYVEKVFFIKINFMLIINNVIQWKIKTKNISHLIKINKKKSDLMIFQQIHSYKNNEYKHMFGFAITD